MYRVQIYDLSVDSEKGAMSAGIKQLVFSSGPFETSVYVVQCCCQRGHVAIPWIYLFCCGLLGSSTMKATLDAHSPTSSLTNSLDL